MRNFKLFVFVLLIIFTSFSFMSCSKFMKEPDVKVESVNIKKINFTDIVLNLKLKIKNPYPIAINLEGLDGSVKVEGNILFMLESPGKVNIQANGESLQEMDVTLRYDDMAKAIKSYLELEELTYTVAGNVSLKASTYGNFRLGFEHSGKLPTIKFNVQVADFNVKLNLPDVGDAVNTVTSAKNALTGFIKGEKDTKIDLPEASIDFSYKIKIANKGKTPVDFSNLNYQLVIAGIKIADGKTESIETVDNVSTITMTQSLDLTDALKKVFTGSSSEYKLAGSIDVGFDIFGKHTIRFDVGEMLKW